MAIRRSVSFNFSAAGVDKVKSQLEALDNEALKTIGSLADLEDQAKKVGFNPQKMKDLGDESKKAGKEAKSFFGDLNSGLRGTLDPFGEVIARAGEVEDIFRVLSGYVVFEIAEQAYQWAKELYSYTKAGQAAARQTEALKIAAEAFTSAIAEQGDALQQVDFSKILSHREVSKEYGLIQEEIKGFADRIAEIDEEMTSMEEHYSDHLQWLKENGFLYNKLLKERINLEERTEGKMRVGMELQGQQKAFLKELTAEQNALATASSSFVDEIDRMALSGDKVDIRKAMDLAGLSAELEVARSMLEVASERALQLANRQKEIQGRVDRGDFGAYLELAMNLGLAKDAGDKLNKATEDFASARKKINDPQYNFELRRSREEFDLQQAGLRAALTDDPFDDIMSKRVDSLRKLKTELEDGKISLAQYFQATLTAINTSNKADADARKAKAKEFEDKRRANEDFIQSVRAGQAALTDDLKDDAEVAHQTSMIQLRRQLKDRLITREQYNEAMALEDARLAKASTDIEKEQERQRLTFRQGIESREIALITDKYARARQQQALAHRQELENFTGTEEQKKEILRTQERETTALIKSQAKEQAQAQIETRRSLNDRLTSLNLSGHKQELALLRSKQQSDEEALRKKIEVGEATKNDLNTLLEIHRRELQMLQEKAQGWAAFSQKFGEALDTISSASQNINSVQQQFTQIGLTERQNALTRAEESLAQEQAAEANAKSEGQRSAALKRRVSAEKEVYKQRMKLLKAEDESQKAAQRFAVLTNALEGFKAAQNAGNAFALASSKAAMYDYVGAGLATASGVGYAAVAAAYGAAAVKTGTSDVSRSARPVDPSQDSSNRSSIDGTGFGRFRGGNVRPVVVHNHYEGNVIATSAEIQDATSRSSYEMVNRRGASQVYVRAR